MICPGLDCPQRLPETIQPATASFTAATPLLHVEMSFGMFETFHSDLLQLLRDPQQAASRVLDTPAQVALCETLATRGHKGK